MADFAPEVLHEHLLERAPRILAFDPEAYFPEWQSAVRRSFKQLLGLMPARVPLDVRIESDTTNAKGEREIRFVFTSEPRAQVPCTLVIPQGGSAQTPIVICLQGHGAGAVWSLEEGHPKGQDFARQAVVRGYAALVMEMRAFGERKDQRPEEMRAGYSQGCQHASMAALLLGRTMVGERVWDVVRAVDVIQERFGDVVDGSRIGVMGFSGGGVVAYYAAAFEPRIGAVLVASSVCTYKDSIARIGHCVDNYIPNILHYFEMADLAGLIVPRPLVMVAGETDPLFPIGAVRECFGDVAAIYRSQGAEAKCRVAVGPDGHRPYPELMWDAFGELWKVI